MRLFNDDDGDIYYSNEKGNKMKWISVKDELPKDKDRILFLSKDKIIVVPFHHCSGYGWFLLQWLISADGLLLPGCFQSGN